MSSLEYWTIYFKQIAEQGSISLGYLLIFFASMLVYFFTKEKKKFPKDYLLVWLWLICGYILLSLPQNKGGERYALPILSPIAIIMAVHVMNISLKPLKYLLVTLAIVMGTINYTYQTASEDCQYTRFDYNYKGLSVLVPVHITCNMQSDVETAYDKDWDVMPIIRYIDNLNGAKSEAVHVLSAVDHNFLNSNSLRLYATLYKLKGEIISNFLFDFVAYKPSDVELMWKLLRENQFVITKSGYQGPDFSNTNNSLVKNLLSKRIPLKSFIMSDWGP